jgi:hypothetical protein
MSKGRACGTPDNTEWGKEDFPKMKTKEVLVNK